MKAILNKRKNLHSKCDIILFLLPEQHMDEKQQKLDKWYMRMARIWAENCIANADR